MTAKREKANQLIQEKSPYLLQHAYNPVNWYPWGEEAFAKAKQEDKPVFLSIGYATCHWCHVMEKECFEDSEVAAVMNQGFIAVKVDREERPDVDTTYMIVCQMLTGSGGWPLSIFMTPDKKPFFAATYIPKQNRFGRLGLMELLSRIDQIWKNQRTELLDSAQKLFAHLQKIQAEPGKAVIDQGVLQKAHQALHKRFDPQNGGFGKAPKFPSPHILLFLLRFYRKNQTPQALNMVETTLKYMRRGGIFDHIGLGFHRYSTDRHWLLPHFEKMLYDQALLLLAYCEAFQVTNNQEYARTAREICAYVLRELTSSDGGFFCAEDADSEGEEGKYYLWTVREIEQVLDSEQARLFKKAYALSEEGNFTEEATGKKSGANIPHLPRKLPEMAREMNIEEQELEKILCSARQKLLSARQKRVRPLLDDKVLTDWNGLMIAALAKAGRILKEPDYIKKAREAADFLLHKLQEGDGSLLHRYRDGSAALKGYLDDYAYLAWGMFELYQSLLQPFYLQKAMHFMDKLFEKFWDQDKGGFFMTAADAEHVLLRQKEIYDGAMPSGNSVALYVLTLLTRICAKPEWEEKIEDLVQAFSETVSQFPAGHTFFLCALDLILNSTQEVIIAAKEYSAATQEFIELLDENYAPETVRILKTEQNAQELESLAPFSKDYQPQEGKTTAYICKNKKCSLPTTDKEHMASLLK